MNYLKLLAAIISVSLLSPSAEAAGAARNRYVLAKFRALPTMVSQGDARTFSLFVGWAPKYALTNFSRLGLNLGGSFLQDNQGQAFLVTEYQATYGYFVHRLWELEAAAGLQTWHRGGGSALLAGANASYLFPKKWMPWIERAVLGYQRRFAGEGRATSQVRLGLGFSF